MFLLGIQNEVNQNEVNQDEVKNQQALCGTNLRSGP
jgi:hypothetical protein